MIAAAAPPLTRRLKIAFGIGSTAESIVLTVSGGFLLLYYNQVRGVPAVWVGMALAAGLVVNALFDPLVGSWSDRMSSPLGRRHPFMFASIVPAALFFFAVFNPPASCRSDGAARRSCSTFATRRHQRRHRRSPAPGKPSWQRRSRSDGWVRDVGYVSRQTTSRLSGWHSAEPLRSASSWYRPDRA